MKKLILAIYIALIFTTDKVHSQGLNDVTIEATQLSDNIYFLKGAGGNIGVSIGDDGLFIIDSQFAPLSEKILDKLKTLSDKPIKVLVNTHFHGDHTGGNANMHNSGATIIAHDNVRKRLESTPKRDGSSNPKEALPVITYNDEMNIYINGEQVAIFHSENAHTDGDSLLYFMDSNVLHTGDTYFSIGYPYIDLKSGGSVNGYIATLEKTLLFLDEETKIISGHGPVSDKAKYQNYLKMLRELKERVLKAISDGKSEDEVANDPNITKDFDEQGYSWRFITSEKIRRTFYQSLSQ